MFSIFNDYPKCPMASDVCWMTDLIIAHMCQRKRVERVNYDPTNQNPTNWNPTNQDGIEMGASISADGMKSGGKYI